METISCCGPTKVTLERCQDQIRPCFISKGCASWRQPWSNGCHQVLDLQRLLSTWKGLTERKLISELLLWQPVCPSGKPLWCSGDFESSGHKSEEWKLWTWNEETSCTGQLRGYHPGEEFNSYGSGEKNVHKWSGRFSRQFWETPSCGHGLPWL